MIRNGAMRIAVALAVGLVCAQISGARAQAPALFELKLYGSIVEDIAPVLYAQQSGLFRRNGLEVTLDPATSGAAVVAAVVSGAYPIGKSSVISGLRAVAKGIPLVAIAPGWVFESKIRSAEMIVATDSPIKTGKDLNGKLIAVASLNELNQIAASAWVDKNGGDFTTVHFVELPIAASAAAVEAHRVDATVLLEPALSAALSTGKVRSLGSAFAALAPAFPVSVWMTTRAWATANPDVVRGFTAALRDAAIYVNAHPVESGALVAAATGMSPDALRRMVRTTAGTSLNERDIVALVAAAQRYKAVSDVDVQSFLY